MIIVIDYGAGNVGNVLGALKALGLEARVQSQPETMKRAALYLLPGVGAFSPAMKRLIKDGWEPFLRDWTLSGGALLGICLGMQLLCERSLEDGSTEGLGLLDGTVSLLQGTRRLPHVGWNSLRPCTASTLPLDGDFYFVHSYGLAESADAVALTDVDGASFVSLALRRNVGGCQFHPERSGLKGVAFLGRLIDHLRKESRQ